MERQFGRAHAAAIAAYKRVQTFCTKIAESHQRLEVKAEVTGPNSENPSNTKSTPEMTRSEQDDSKSADGTTNDVKDVGRTSQDLSGDNSQGRTQLRDSDPPSCGKCTGRLSFPCWYCTKCAGQSRRLICSPRVLMCHSTLLDNLFLCDACDGEGVPELMRSSGKHAEDHHLIRCLAPEEEDDTSSTDRRLISLEDRLTSMQSQFDDLTGRIGNMEQLLHRLAAASEAPHS